MTYRIVDDVLYGADELVAEWVARKLGTKTPGDRPYVALGVTNGQDLLGGMVFFNQRGNSEIYFTVAAESPKAMKLRALGRCYAYAFNQLGVRRITAEIEMKNTRSIRLAQGVGFVREGVKRKAAPDGGHVGVFGLLLKDFKLRRYMP